MRKPSWIIATIGAIGMIGMIGVLAFRSLAFIERQYTIEEVVEASTHILFGRIGTVDKTKQRIIVLVEKGVKGKSEFQQINVNVAVGDVRAGQSTPEILLQRVKADQPAIVFYEDQAGRLAGLVYTENTWFQIFGSRSGDPNKVWWNFSHIEIHMHRTYQGDSRKFQQLVEAMASGRQLEATGVSDKSDKKEFYNWPSQKDKDMVRVLVLSGRGSPVVRKKLDSKSSELSATSEFISLMGLGKVKQWDLAYRASSDLSLPALEEAQLLWIGFREIWRDGYHLDKKTEIRIRNFVKQGGVAIVSGQDYDDNRSLGTGWIPEPIGGVELNQMPLKSTGHLPNLLQSPQKVNLSQLVIDDAWTGLSEKYVVALETADSRGVALAQLRYGQGFYLITALSNANQQAVEANQPLMENLIHYAVEQLMSR